MKFYQNLNYFIFQIFYFTNISYFPLYYCPYLQSHISCQYLNSSFSFSEATSNSFCIMVWADNILLCYLGYPVLYIHFSYLRGSFIWSFRRWSGQEPHISISARSLNYSGSSGLYFLSLYVDICSCASILTWFHFLEHTPTWCYENLCSKQLSSAFSNNDSS